ncbi:hypothetical protein KM043_011866 [Ampulex compressa]|nr:hypothetical protein KM043_011866 [Ampulex compressa]
MRGFIMFFVVARSGQKCRFAEAAVTWRDSQGILSGARGCDTVQRFLLKDSRYETEVSCDTLEVFIERFVGGVRES